MQVIFITVLTMKDEQLLRYSRHIFLPELDLDGQMAICDARILVIGLGGLGCAALPYLAASGVGEITLVDDDQVELSNLPRQILHSTERVGRSKVSSAVQSLQPLNPDIKLQPIERRVDALWLMQQAAQHDVIVDCTDNADVRYAINQAALAHTVPWVSGAAIAMGGQITVFDPRQASSPCYRCLYSAVNQQQLNCSESGVLSPLVGVIGTLQAVETIKLLAGIGRSLCGTLLTYDALNGGFNEWKIKRNEQCPDCGDH